MTCHCCSCRNHRELMDRLNEIHGESLDATEAERIARYEKYRGSYEPTMKSGPAIPQWVVILIVLIVLAVVAA